MYIETTLKKWTDIFKIESTFVNNFVFRGQKESEWDLKTSIERTPSFCSIFREINGVNLEERWMIDHFKRKQHIYSDDFRIIENCKFSILSKIQHYGGKTRLLDFTHSMFIAIYFAVEDSFLFEGNNNSYSSLWFVNKRKLKDVNNEKFNLYKKEKDLKDKCREVFIEFANQFIAKNYSNDDKDTITTILPLEVEYFNERISKQQGVFLMPTNSEKSFMENLWYSFNPTEKDYLIDENFNKNLFAKKDFDDFLQVATKDIDVVKINIQKAMSRDIINSLTNMNITPEILFPGLIGLAKSVYNIGSDN
jgi:hypothetical protein